jgi:hypothetical protein
MLVSFFLLLFSLFAPASEGAGTNTITWVNPTTYRDALGIPGTLRSTVETRLYYSLDGISWKQFASAYGGGETWTGVLPVEEGTVAYYAATATIPVDGIESGLSAPLIYPVAADGGSSSAGEVTVVVGSGQDTYVDLGAGINTNYSSTPLVRTYVWPDNNVANRGFLKWDISSVPTGAQVTRASLRLYYAEEVVGGGDDVIPVRAAKVIGVNPDIGRATWNSPDAINAWVGGGGGNLAEPESIVNVGKTHGWVEWNVTNMTKEWVDAPLSNFGVAIDAGGRIDSNRYFASFEYPDPGLRPQLVVTYDPEPVPVAATYTVSVANVGDTFLNIGGFAGTNYSSEPLIRTYTWPAYHVANRGFIRWDLSVIPAGATVTSANLWLYYVAEDSGGGDNAYMVTVSKLTGVRPDPALATWNTYDGVFPWPGGQDGGEGAMTLPESYAAVGKSHQWVSWNVTELVREWIADPEKNYVMVVDGDESASCDSNRHFASGEYPDAVLRPQLQITYELGR